MLLSIRLIDTYKSFSGLVSYSYDCSLFLKIKRHLLTSSLLG